MTETIRLLTDEGVKQFNQYILTLRADPIVPPPLHLLTDPETSSEASFNATITQQALGRPYYSAYELGEYLCTSVLRNISKPLISRESRLWNWLALFLFNELCPIVNGQRAVLETAAYILDKQFNYARYYRHLIRSAWVLVAVHGAYSKVLLSPGSKNHSNPVAIRTDIQMQLSATQQFVESSSVIQTAYALYYDETTNRLKSGSATKGDGAPRRLVSVLNQFDLTYDLHASPADTLISLMPKEFDRFKGKQKTKLRSR
jgi:hypothetical protein